MKKFSLVFALVLALVFSFTTTTLASAQACPEQPTNESNVKYIDPLDRKELIELPRDETDAIEQYRWEVRMRDNHPYYIGGYLVPPCELDVYEKYGLVYDYQEKCVYATEGYGAFVPSFDYPVIFNTGDVKQLWYTDSEGMLCMLTLNRDDWKSVKFTYTDINVHCDLDDGNDVIINSNPFFAVTYNQEYGSVKVWLFGLMLREHEIPTESVYAGLSSNEGYIFRSGTDVYAVREYGCYAGGDLNGVEHIAQDVKLVLETDYYMGWEGWSQPLLLMIDGTVKVFYSGVSEFGGSQFIDVNDLYDVTVDGGGQWE